MTNAEALDGSVEAAQSSGKIVLSFTTANANDVIVVSSDCTGTTAIGISSITDNLSTHLTYARRKNASVKIGAAFHAIDYWTAVWTGSGAITITVTLTGTPTSGVGYAFGVSGANTSTPFDPNSSLPASGTSATGAATVTISTSLAYDFLIAFIDGSMGHDSGFTVPQSSALSAIEYEVVSSQQSNLVLNPSSHYSAYVLIADAIQALSQPSAPSYIPSSMGDGLSWVSQILKRRFPLPKIKDLNKIMQKTLLRPPA